MAHRSTGDLSSVSIRRQNRTSVAVDLAGKITWLTGASSGIGEAMAYALAAEGSTLVLSARRAQELERVRAACANSDAHFTLPLDLMEPNSFPAAMATVFGRFPHVDIMVHCAGISQRGTALETKMEVDRRVMEVNHFAPVALTRAILPSMIARRAGHIVVINSLLGKFSTTRRSAYCASKHASIGFFDALRAEVHQHGISITMICPGFVRTNASVNALGPDGTPHGKMDHDIRNGIASDVCASQIVRAIRQQKREVYIGDKKRFAVYLERYMPGLFSRLVRARHPR